MKLLLRIVAIMSILVATQSCSKDDDVLSNGGDSSSDIITIEADGSNNMSAKVIIVDDYNLFIDGVKYTAKGAYMLVSGCDPYCSGSVKIYGKIKYRNNTYDVKAIGEKAFYESKITSITIPNSIVSIRTKAFTSSSLESIVLPESIDTIGNNSFSYCKSLKNVKCPSSVVRLGEEAFKYCSNLESINLPEVKDLFVRTFYGCAKLDNITIPSSWKGLPYQIFYECTSLSNITINEGVTYIGSYVFFRCDSLRTIMLPSSIEYIYSPAFSVCTNLTKIFSRAITPPGSDGYVFSDPSECRLIVPKDSRIAYGESRGWSNFRSIDGWNIQ